jgi:hypothetical protein
MRKTVLPNFAPVLLDADFTRRGLIVEAGAKTLASALCGTGTPVAHQ